MGPADPKPPLALSQPFLSLGTQFPSLADPAHPTTGTRKCPFSVLSPVARLSRPSSRLSPSPAHSGPCVLIPCLQDCFPLGWKPEDRGQVRQGLGPEVSVMEKLVSVVQTQTVVPQFLHLRNGAQPLSSLHVYRNKERGNRFDSPKSDTPRVQKDSEGYRTVELWHVHRPDYVTEPFF